MNCPNCGTVNPEGTAFCGNCGTSMPAAPAAPPPVPPVPPTAPVPPVPPAAPPVQVPPVVGGGDPTMVGGYPPGPPTTPPAGFAVPPPGAMPPPGAPVAPAEKKSKKSLLLGLLALLVVAGLVGGYLVFSGDDESAGGDIILEPIGQSITDDFAGDLDLQPTGSSIANILPGLPPLGSGIASLLSGLEADGDTPGLYGGTRDVGTCDVEQLVEFLTDEDNEDKAEAWADTLGIEVGDIEEFVGDLTPVRLRFDTRVTNHGFVDGGSNAFQSILESGTAVLVDDEGVPRVKCNCGNPLTEPEDAGDVSDDDALDESVISNPDDAWDEFDPEQVVVVSPGDEVEKFTLVDIETGEIFDRPVGTDGTDDQDPEDLDAVCELLGESPTCGAPPDDDDDDDEETTTTTEPEEEGTTTTVVLGTGDVQVTLEWGSNADLDLAVTDPNGETVNFGNRGPSSTGGQLDVDSNVGCPADARSGVENVFWPPGQAPAGTYTVEVNGFSVGEANGCGGGDYTLTILVEGSEPQVIEDSVEESETDTHVFQVG
jgi:hypothetical protein